MSQVQLLHAEALYREPACSNIDFLQFLSGAGTFCSQDQQRQPGVCKAPTPRPAGRAGWAPPTSNFLILQGNGWSQFPTAMLPLSEDD